METVVQTPPSYTRSGTGHRNPSQPGPSGFSSHQRRGQVASATSAGYGRGRNVSSEGGGWAPRKRRGSFGMNSGAGGNGPGVGWGGSNGGGDSNNNTSHNNNSNNTNNNTNNSNNNNSNNSSNNRFKRRKRQHPDIVLPTKFMLGGSITDPLNLRSLENEEVNRLANQTPVASPAPAAGGGSERVEVIIPRDIKDPLNLNAPEPPAMEASSEQRSQQLNTSTSANDGKRNRDNSTNSKSSNSQLQTKKNRRRRNRNHHQHGRFTGSGLSWRAGAGPSGSNNWSPTGPASGYDIADKYQSAHSGRGRGVRSNKNNINSNDNVGQNKSLAKTTTAEDKTDNTNNSGGCSSSNNGKNTTAASTGANIQNNANVSDSSNNNNNNNSNSTTKNNVSGDGKKSSANQRFRYGNYNRYYGYRNGTEADSRLSLLKRKWFENKVCLDIGCNVGHVTLSVARDYGPREIIGMDIDQTLIRIARKNVRHYVHEENVQGSWFPESCAITFGPIAIAPVRGGASGGGTSYRSTNMPEVDGGSANHRRGGGPGASNRDGAASTNSSYTGLPVPFPYNIFFTRGNYVLDTDELLETQREEFDTIMCLSTSKWIQLNFGDEGLKRTFKRVFRQLRPGGRFLFEPQPLSSYHKFCAPEHRENFRQMQLKPDEFPDYLTREVGFASCRILGVGNHGAKNFQRPLYLLRKAKTEKTPMQGNSDNGQSRNTPNSSPAGQGNKTSERTDPFKDERNKDPSISRSFEAPPSQPSLPRPSPAHECDTTTASI